MMTKSASSTSTALMAVDESSDLTESQIFAALPNPVFVLDLENRFIYLNQAAEIFFQSSRMILLGTALTSVIPADSNLLSMVRRAQAQSISVGDQGVELAGPKIGLKLINVQITPLVTGNSVFWYVFKNGHWPKDCAASHYSAGRPDRLRQWRRYWPTRSKTRWLASKAPRNC